MFLANGEINWVELIFVLLVFGGGAIGAFLKWLVAKFTPDESKKAQPGVPPPGRKAQGAPMAQPRPVARPVPPARRAGAKPQAGRPGQPAHSRPAAPVRPVMTEPRRAEQPPRAQPPKVIPVATPPKKEERHEHRRLRSRLRGHHLDPNVSIREIGRTEAEDVAEEAELITEHAEGQGLPTHAELRRAIILRELLGPPVSLRARPDVYEL
jgi:hypothetical protein